VEKNLLKRVNFYPSLFPNNISRLVRNANLLQLRGHVCVKVINEYSNAYW
jgi:hypothetical protein